MDGTELCIRFSHITNQLRFCGPKEASEQFFNYLKNKDNRQQVESVLRKFEGLFPYLSAIAGKNNRNPFDHEVIEAYWIGNNLLDSFNDEDLKNIIKTLIQRGLPESIGENLIKNLPSSLIPHHNFNVFYVGTGNITNSVKPTLENMNNCMISWGKVTDINDNELTINSISIKKPKDKFFIEENQTKKVKYLKEMFPNIKKGDQVALHWNSAALILTDQQLNNLKKYTQKILDILYKN